MRRLIPILSAAAALFLAPVAVSSGAKAQSEDLQLHLGYDGRLLIKVLDIEVEARADRGGFGAQAQLTSSGILALLKHIHQVASSQGPLVNGEPRPGEFETQNLAGKTHRKVRTVWSGGQVLMTAQPAYHSLGDPPATPQQKLQAADPLTEFMRVALAGTKDRTCNRTYMLFDGKQLYALDFGPAFDAPPTSAEQRLGLGGAFRCDVRFREVAGFGKKPPDQRDQGLKRPIQVRFARLGPDGPLLLTSLRADTPLGRGSVELARLQTAGRAGGQA